MKLLIASLLFSATVFAFDKDFKTSNERLPFDFILLFNSLKVEMKTSPEKIRMVGLCQEIEANLGILEKQHIYLLLKSEIAKGVLEHKFSKVRQFDVTTTLLSRLEEDFIQKSKYLNPFSKYIWRSLMADLRAKVTSGILTDKSFDPNKFDGAKRIEAYRFQRYLKYLLPWIDKMDSLSAVQFNELTKEISWDILEKLNERAQLFKRFASAATTETQTRLFNIPQRLLNVSPEDIKKAQSDAPLTLQERAQKEKSDAQATVEQVTPEDMSTVSEDVMKELDKTAE
jgi:hypothetical protein